MSPLVVMTADREYTVAAEPGKLPARAVDNAVAGMGKASSVTGFQAAYGSTHAQAARQAAQRHAAAGLQSVLNPHAGGKPPWADLFDAPSHVLPPLSSMLPIFLDMMMKYPDNQVGS